MNKRIPLYLVPAICLFSLAMPSPAQGKPALPNRINMHPFLGNPPIIDGKLTENEWSCASQGLVILAPGGDRLVKPFGRFVIGYRESTIYFMFVTDTMGKMPSAAAVERDGSVWLDDSAELHLNLGPDRYQLIVNPKGTFWDAKNSHGAWNGPWTVAAGTIGDPHAVAETRRGFVVEAALDLKKAGIPLPAPGSVGHIQVVFNLAGKNPHAVWNPMDGMLIGNRLGELYWGGCQFKLNTLEIADQGRRIHVGGDFGNYVGSEVRIGGGVSIKNTWLRTIDETIKIPGGSRYVFEMVSAPALYFSFPGQSELSIPVTAVPNPPKKAFYVECDSARLGANNKGVLDLQLRCRDREVWNGRIDLACVTGRKVLDVPYDHLPAGAACQMIVSRRDKAGKPEELGRIALKVPAGEPQWAQWKLPPMPAVPEPFIPIQGEINSAKVWGRTYQFGHSPFLDQITSAGENILASPVTLRGTVNGKSFAWHMTSWKKTNTRPDRVVYEANASAEGLSIQVKTSIEYDGMVRYDWTLLPASAGVTVDNLHLVIPFRPAIARSFMQYSLEGYTFSDEASWNKSGDIPPGGWACRFTPCFWIGDQYRGLQWFAEHHAGWTPADENKTIEVKRNPGSVDLVLHLADGKRTFKKPIDFTFGLMASPVRPRVSSSELSGTHIAVISAPRDDFQRQKTDSSIFIPYLPSDMTVQGCVEMDVRVDTKNSLPVIDLFRHQNSKGNTIYLRWNREQKIVEVIHQTPNGEKSLINTSLSFEKDRWYRLAFNWGPQTQIYLDGRLIGQTADPNPAPDFDYWASDLVGGSGKISLRGWRLSSRNRTSEELRTNTRWKPDRDTRHLEILLYDPTPMNITNPQVAGPGSPAYLQGTWKYNPAERSLTVQEISTPVNLMEDLARTGISGVTVFGWSRDIEGHGPPANPEAFNRYVAQANQAGIRVLPYTPWGIIETDPEFQDYKYEMSFVPPYLENDSVWRARDQVAYYACPNSSVGNRVLWSVDQLLRRGTGGVYLDGHCEPRICSNPMHGHDPVIDPITGKPVQVWRIFGKREFMKKLAGLIHHYRKDGFIDAHMSCGFILPTMSMVTHATNGESLGAVKDWKKSTSPAVIRAEYSGRQYGFDVDALFYNNSPVPVETGIALMGIHGQTPRCMWGLHPSRAKGIWNLAKQFDTAGATWFSYYDPACPVKTNHPGVYASVFVHPGKRALILIANLGEKTVDETLLLDLKKMGLPADCKATICNWNIPLPVENGTVPLLLKPSQLLFIWLGPVK